MMDHEGAVGSGLNIELDTLSPHCLRALEGRNGVLGPDSRSTSMGNDDRARAHSPQ
jgi:hypothetical protein